MSFLERADGKDAMARPITVDPLVAAAEHETRRRQRQAGFAGVFDGSIVYVETCAESDRPVVHEQPDGRWVHAYPQYEDLPGARQHDEVWHRRINGGELRALLAESEPEVGVVFAPGAPHEQRLPAPAFTVSPRARRSRS